MLKQVRKLVSRDRCRYQQGGYDLDLSYITDNVLGICYLVLIDLFLLLKLFFVAMSFPSQGLTSVWRNSIDDVRAYFFLLSILFFLKKSSLHCKVCKLLNTHHPNAFMIWNLSEHKYNYDKFDFQVRFHNIELPTTKILDYPFPDHHAPALSMLFSIVQSMDNWLCASPENVAVVHCKVS